MHTHTTLRFLRSRCGLVLVWVLMATVGGGPVKAYASAWGPTLLVNTESFQTIDEGDSTTDVEIRFGDTLNEKIYWNRGPARFEFSDDVHAQGNITGSGTLKVDGSITTEGDLTLNQDQTAADTVLTFGSDTTNETLKFLNLEDRFEVSDDLRTTGNLYSSGTLIVDGAAVLKSTVKLNGVIYTFPTSDGSASGKVLKTNAAGQLSWSADSDTGASGITYADAKSYFVDDTGDTMTGALTIKRVSGTTQNLFTVSGGRIVVQTTAPNNAVDLLDVSGGSLKVSGNINATGTILSVGNISTRGDLTINTDQTAADTILTFGSDTTNETLKFLNTADRFEFSDDLRATGDIVTAGTLSGAKLNVMSGANAYVLSNLGIGTTAPRTKLDVAGVISGAKLSVPGTVTLNNVAYTFPQFDGAASGKVLKTSGAGVLSWGSDAATVRSSGGMVFLQPQFPNAVYFGSGAATASVGTLGLRYDSGSTVNFYRWQSTKTSNQQYWIITRVRVPDQFSSWDIQKPIEFRNRASGGYLELRMLDTSNNIVALTGHTGISNSAWTTTTVTGPQTSGTFASGGYLTLMVKMISSGALVTNRAYADVGFINLNMETKTVAKP